jgi:hypothetical protein
MSEIIEIHKNFQPIVRPVMLGVRGHVAEALSNLPNSSANQVTEDGVIFLAQVLEESILRSLAGAQILQPFEALDEEVAIDIIRQHSKPDIAVHPDRLLLTFGREDDEGKTLRPLISSINIPTNPRSATPAIEDRGEVVLLRPQFGGYMINYPRE